MNRATAADGDFDYIVVGSGAGGGTVAARLADSATRAGCALRLDFDPCPGRWDRSRLDQVVSNLLSNAIKYGPNAPIMVRLSCLSERVELRVHSLVLELTGKKEPQDGLQGKFSVYHGFAAGLVFGRAGEGEYDDHVVTREDMVALRRKVVATSIRISRSSSARKR